jgi:hypothetical protein
MIVSIKIPKASSVEESQGGRQRGPGSGTTEDVELLQGGAAREIRKGDLDVKPQIRQGRQFDVARLVNREKSWNRYM